MRERRETETADYAQELAPLFTGAPSRTLWEEVTHAIERFDDFNAEARLPILMSALQDQGAAT